MALLDRMMAKAEGIARDLAEGARKAVEVAVTEFPDIILNREGDELVLSGRGLMRRWMSDVRLRFAFWRRG